MNGTYNRICIAQKHASSKGLHHLVIVYVIVLSISVEKFHFVAHHIIIFDPERDYTWLAGIYFCCCIKSEFLDRENACVMLTHNDGYLYLTFLQEKPVLPRKNKPRETHTATRITKAIKKNEYSS